jgi:polar amino acid transport system substrate-binding protein
MKTFKTFLLVAAAAITLGTTAAKADLVFATDTSAYPPFTSQNASGQFEGWEFDLMNAVCAEMNEKCTMVPIAWDGIIPALLEKKMDGIFGSMSITDERKKQIDFSEMYYNSAAVIIGNKNGDMKFSPEDLSGKTIGVQGATIHQNYVDKYYVPKGARVKAYQKQDEANADLAAGRVDYLMADGVALQAYLASDEGKACCELKGAVPDDKSILGYGVGVGLRKEDTAMKDKINAAFKAVAAKGVFEELNKKYKLEGLMIVPPKG